MAFTATTSNSAKAWAPDLYEFAPADVVPQALILQCTTVAGTVEGDAPSVYVAYIDDDEAQFTAEGDTIPEADPELSQAVVHTAKATQLVRVSREQYQQNGTAAQLSQSVARALTRRGDKAFAAEAAPTSPAVAPVAGLANTTGIIDGGGVSDNLDKLVDLIAQLQDNLSTPSHILLDPLGWAEFRKLKVGGSDTNESLLGAGTSDAAQRLLSLPVIVNPAVPDYGGFVVDRTAIVSAVGPVMVGASEHTYFDSDSVALRATWRFGHVVVRPDRIGKFAMLGDLTAITVTPATKSLAVAATQQLTVKDSDNVDRTAVASYSSSDDTKATVSAAGLVTGVAAGSATITATYRGLTATCAVTVTS